VYVGRHGNTARAQSRLRAAVNARLEEISFRTGLITATIGLVALAAAGVFAATLSLGNQAIAAAGALSTVSAPKTTQAVTASAPPAIRPQASATPRATPRATHPVTVATTSPQSAAGPQPWPQAGGSQASPRYYGQAGYGSRGSWYGGRGSWYGGRGSWYGGRGSWPEGSWPGHGGPGFPGYGSGLTGPRRP
jgi:hypothetical protein